MARKRRILRWIAYCLALLIVLALLGLYLAVRHEPAFYRRALQADPAELAKGSDRLVRQAAALQSVGQREGRWEAVITAVEINGWLAVDLAKNHPNALPPALKEPRVAIDPSGITMACRYQQGVVNSVLNLKVQPYLAEPNVIALRIVRARAGAMPAPLRQVLDAITEAARAADLPLQWRPADGDPVALLPLPTDEGDRIVRIEKIELREGEIYVTGSTQRRKP
jgi:hypothetical protein